MRKSCDNTVEKVRGQRREDFETAFASAGLRQGTVLDVGGGLGVLSLELLDISTAPRAAPVSRALNRRTWPMMDVADIQELYQYNQWANGRIFEAVRGLTPREFTTDMGSSYPSIHDTLVHIVWAEWIWLQRWKAISPKFVFETRDFPSLDALRAKWSDVEREQRAFLDTLTSERLLAVVPYVNLQGQTWQYPLWRQMYHVVNHSTYHRGQLTTMLRQLGAQAVATDLLVFYDELVGQ